MLKIRLKRLGAKKAPTYRVIVINSTTKREGKPIEELGYYNPKTKEMKLNKESALAWISKGAQPTDVIGVTRQELGQITPTGGGQSQDFEGFQRNNVYQITAKVGKLGIQIVRVSVEPWGDPKNIDVDVEL